MTRRQLRAMVRWESLVIGAVAFPWARLALFLVFAVLAGVAAAVLPARRAARLDVLAAVAHQ